MGKAKELWMEMQEQARDEKIAETLGITYDELSELDWAIEEDSSDDGMIYNYRIEITENSPKDILSKIDRLEDGCRVYLNQWEIDDDYDYDEQFDAITEDKEYVQKYRNEIANLNALCGIEVNNAELQTILHRQIFIGIIGTMETFLSDTFINLTFDNEKYFKNFIQTHPDFKQRRFDLSDIFEESAKIKETARKIMLDTIYHNLPTVKNMYTETFNLKFPDIKDVYIYVLKRHDLVHRNGRTKEGNVVEIDQSIIQNLTIKINEFVDKIIAELKV